MLHTGRKIRLKSDFSKHWIQMGVFKELKKNNFEHGILYPTRHHLNKKT